MVMIGEELGRRIRNLEMKVERFESKIGELERKIVEMAEEIKITKEFMEKKYENIWKEMEELKKWKREMEEKLNQYVKVSEIEKLKTMLEIFNPLKSSFITREELKMELENLLNQFKSAKQE
ncbi:MAG: hypothetical protein QXI09_02840 [Candidatus Aenigmatarchaeota archaeon]